MRLGAIRWTPWYSTTGTAGLAEMRTLSNPDWQHMAPPHAVNIRPDRIRFDASQARMDAEIGWANAAGVYWVWLMYSTGLSDDPTSPGMRAGLDRYIASSAKGGLKWAMMQQPANMGAPGNYTAQVNTIADLMLRPDYERVLTNRPILYIYASAGYVGGAWAGDTAAFALAVAALRSRVQSLGAGNPYVVTCGVFGGSAAEAFRAAVGADAVSLYATGGQGRNNRPFTELAAYAAGMWSTQLAAAGVVPLAMSGWDRRPREARPGPWEPQYLPGMGSTGWYQRASNSELAAHIGAAKTFIGTNPTKCTADTALIYSWDEFSEGGYPLCPTRAEVLAGTHTARLVAIAGAI